MRDWFKVLSLLFSVFLMATDASSAEVKNERVRQDGNRILFEYDLEGDGEADVSISITVDGKKYGAKELHIEGDYGNVHPGNNKRIYWNVLQDFPRGLHGNFEAEIAAGGGAPGEESAGKFGLSVQPMTRWITRLLWQTPRRPIKSSS